MTDRWVPDPQPADGPDGRGESGPAETLETREEAEITAETGRFPDGQAWRDASNPLDPEAEGAGRPEEAPDSGS